VALSALPPRLEPVDPRKDMEMIENRQNKADCSGVCLCQITIYDKNREVPRGALMAAETSGISTYLYQTPVQFR